MTTQAEDSEAKTFSTRPGEARIYINCGAGSRIGIGLTFSLCVDDDPVPLAFFGRNTYVALIVPPGKHHLQWHSNGDHRLEQMDIVVEGAQIYFYEITPHWGWFGIDPMPEQERRKHIATSSEVQSLSYDHVLNWPKLQKGMSSAEVSELVGRDMRLPALSPKAQQAVQAEEQFEFAYKTVSAPLADSQIARWFSTIFRVSRKQATILAWGHEFKFTNIAAAGQDSDYRLESW